MADNEFATLDSILDGLNDNTSTEDQSNANAGTDNNVGGNTESGANNTGADENQNNFSQQNQTQQQQQSQQQQQQQQTQQQPQVANNQAFAAMRAQNNKQAKLLEAIGPLLGLDANLKGDQLYKAIEDKALKEQATKLNTSPELLSQLQQQGALLNSLVQEREKSAVFNKFTSLQQEFNLSKDQVYGFVGELQNSGYSMADALEHLPDLYRGMHYQELVERAANEAVQKALKHDNSTNNHSSNPGNTMGNGATDDDKDINTVSALDDLLRDVKL